MISVVIRNRNQANSLEFLLKNLTKRYANDISEIIVIDNLSTDESKSVSKKFNARFETIENFTYGGSANLAAEKANNRIVVIFSAHSYPVSHDFFKLILEKFNENPKLAGLRCLHSPNDFKNFMNGMSAEKDTDKSGLIFSGSAFSKKVWEKHPFRNEVATFEDKEWSKRVLELGYEIDFVESIFYYDIKRTKKQNFFRFKNDLIGNYQLWHKDVNLFQVSKGFIVSIFKLIKEFFIDIYYVILKFFYHLKFIIKKPKKF